MFDRSMLRDAAFAILLGVPTLALARPQTEPAEAPSMSAKPLVEQAALVEQDASERRFAMPETGV